METIIKKAKAGDKLALNKLVNQWYARIYNFALKYMGDEDLASEVTQRTFIKVYQKIGQLKNVESFKSWLYQIALNYCREEQRKIKNKWTVSLYSQKDDEEFSNFNEKDSSRRSNPEETLYQNELSDLLQKALSEISEEQRLVVIMKEYEGLKFKEIAKTLNISENTAKSRLYQGLKALKKKLDLINNGKLTMENLIS